MKMGKGQFAINEKRALAHLSDLYSEVYQGVRELVQNGYDAFASEIAIGTLMTVPCAIVVDNGIGMNEYILENGYLRAASEEKGTRSKHLEQMPSFPEDLRYSATSWTKEKCYEEAKEERKVIGGKGIGRFAWKTLGYKTVVFTKTVDDEEGHLIEMKGENALDYYLEKTDLEGYLDYLTKDDEDFEGDILHKDEVKRSLTNYIKEFLNKHYGNWEHGTIYVIFDRTSSIKEVEQKTPNQDEISKALSNDISDMYHKIGLMDFDSNQETQNIVLRASMNIPYDDEDTDSMFNNLRTDLGWLVKETENFEVNVEDYSILEYNDKWGWNWRTPKYGIEKGAETGLEFHDIGEYEGGEGEIYEYEYRLIIPEDSNRGRTTTLLNRWIGVRKVQSMKKLFDGYVNVALKVSKNGVKRGEEGFPDMQTTSRNDFIPYYNNQVDNIEEKIVTDIIIEMSNSLASGQKRVENAIRENFEGFLKLSYNASQVRRRNADAYCVPHIEFPVIGYGEYSMIDLIEQKRVGEDGQIWIANKDDQETKADRMRDLGLITMKIDMSTYYDYKYGLEYDIKAWSRDVYDILKWVKDFPSEKLRKSGKSVQRTKVEDDALSDVQEILNLGSGVLENTIRKMEEHGAPTEQIQDVLQGLQDAISDAKDKGNIHDTDYTDYNISEEEEETEEIEVGEKKVSTKKRSEVKTFKRNEDDYVEMLFHGRKIMVGFAEFADENIVASMSGLKFLDMNTNNIYIKMIREEDNDLMRKLLLINPIAHELSHLNSHRHDKLFVDTYNTIYTSMMRGFREKYGDKLQKIDSAEEDMDLLTLRRLEFQMLNNNYKPVRTLIQDAKEGITIERATSNMNVSGWFEKLTNWW